MLVIEQRRAFGRRAHDDERDARQGSLFAADALSPPAKPPGPTPDPFAPPHTPTSPEAASAPLQDVLAQPPSGPAALAPDAIGPAADAVGSGAVARTTDAVSAPHDAAALPPDGVAPPSESFAAAWPGYAGEAEDATAVADYADPVELEPAHARVMTSRSVLAGPTLDDLMSRVWEGLRAEVPTPCPVCRTEIEPSAHGRCGGCGSALD